MMETCKWFYTILVIIFQAFLLFLMMEFDDTSKQLELQRSKLLWSIQQFIDNFNCDSLKEKYSIFNDTQFNTEQYFRQTDSRYLEVNQLNKLQQTLNQIIQLNTAFCNKQTVIEQLYNTDQLNQMASQQQCAVMFIDIKGFTSFSEKSDLLQILNVLTVVYQLILKASDKYGGIVSSFLGDGALVLFSVKTLKLNDKICDELDGQQVVENCCTCALQLIQEQQNNQMETKEIQNTIQQLDLKIGIHFGTCLIGLFGDATRKLSYTALGDVVNTASRIEQATRQFGVHILVSSTVADILSTNFYCIKSGQIKAKGKVKNFYVYELIGDKNNLHGKDRFETYQTISQFMKCGQYNVALGEIDNYLEKYKNDYMLLEMQQKCLYMSSQFYVDFPQIKII